VEIKKKTNMVIVRKGKDKMVILTAPPSGALFWEMPELHDHPNDPRILTSHIRDMEYED